MENTKKWYESKTLQLAALQGVVGIVTVLATQYPTIGYIALVKSILDIFVRLNTDSTLN